MPVVLSWNAARSATSYNVKRSTSPGGPFTTVASVSVPGYSDSSVLAGTTYYYVVSSVNTFGEGTNSSSRSSLGLLRSDESDRSDGSGKRLATHPELEPFPRRHRVQPGPRNQRNALQLPCNQPHHTSYTDTDLVAGVIYYYAVAAANDCNQGPFSAALAAALPPPPPTGLAAQRRKPASPADLGCAALAPGIQCEAFSAPGRPVRAGRRQRHWHELSRCRSDERRLPVITWSVPCWPAARVLIPLQIAATPCGGGLPSGMDRPGHRQPRAFRECLILRGWVHPARRRG